MGDLVFSFRTADNMALVLKRMRPDQQRHAEPVMLVHGAGVRSRIFEPPLETTLPAMLVAQGHDVWLLDWRASIDHPPNLWTLDQAAVFDYPAAIAEIRRVTGAHTLKAVIHCQGSTSFMMALCAGLLPEVSVVVSNAVALHTQVPFLARVKSAVATDTIGRLFDYLNPQWGLHAPGFAPRLIDWWVRATHHECRNAVCKHASFAYGAGFPTLWRHENLNDQTHEWMKGEFAAVPMTFFRQMKRCISAGHLVSTGAYDALPADFVAQAPCTDARILFLCGERNECFVAEGMARSCDFFERHAPGRHDFQQVAGYGHLDIFIGKDAAADVLPMIVHELGRA